jgi:hypothetical protein
MLQYPPEGQGPAVGDVAKFLITMTALEAGQKVDKPTGLTAYKLAGRGEMLWERGVLYCFFPGVEVTRLPADVNPESDKRVSSFAEDHKHAAGTPAGEGESSRK